MQSISLTRSEQLWSFILYLENKGYETDPILTKNFIPLTAKTDPTVQLTSIQVYGFLGDVINRYGLKNLGWEVGRQFGAQALGGLTLDAFAQGGQRALVKLNEASRAHATNARFFILKDKSHFELCNIGSMPARTEAIRQAEHYLTMVYIDFVRRAFDRSDYFPTRVKFRSHQGDYLPAPLREIQTDYDQPYFSVDIPVDWYKEISASHALPSPIEPMTLSNTLGELIRAHVDSGIPTIQDASAITDVKIRNLQRQLAAEGTSYKQLVLAVKMQAAVTLLTEENLSIADVSEKLRYSQPSHFVRAFKKWRGVTPFQYRSTLSSV